VIDRYAAANNAFRSNGAQSALAGLGTAERQALPAATQQCSYERGLRFELDTLLQGERFQTGAAKNFLYFISVLLLLVPHLYH
jgi:hypothetical protein